jgi:hypothetical protein
MIRYNCRLMPAISNWGPTCVNVSVLKTCKKLKIQILIQDHYVTEPRVATAKDGKVPTGKPFFVYRKCSKQCQRGKLAASRNYGYVEVTDQYGSIPILDSRLSFIESRVCFFAPRPSQAELFGTLGVAADQGQKFSVIVNISFSYDLCSE